MYGFCSTFSVGAFPALLPEVGAAAGLADWQIGLVAGLLGFARMAADVPVGLVITHHLRRTLTVAPFVLALGAIWSGRWRIVRAARARPRADGRRPRAHRGERPHRAAALRAGGRDGAGPHRVRDVGDDRRAMERGAADVRGSRSEEHTSELQSHHEIVCRLLLEKKKKKTS